MIESQIHILIIDDNEDILTMLKVMLEYNDYKVSAKSNTNNYKEVIKALQPHIIIMDKLLSGSDGCQVCKDLKMNLAFAAIPIIMISAHPQVETECLEAGADFFLEKPFEMNDLLRTVALVIKTIK